MIELLVVMSIMVILLAALVPAVFSIDEDGRLVSGVNTIEAGTKAARALAAKKRASLVDIPAATDSGVALIVTPSNELRLAINNQRATFNGRPIENDGYNGYRDAPARDYIQMPRGIGVAGIVAPNDQPGAIIPPPFAIRYDGQGALIAGIDPNWQSGNAIDVSTLVIYDDDPQGNNGQGDYDYSDVRPMGYNPNDFDPEKGALKTNTAVYDTAEGRWRLPFEVLEPVVGVVIYAKGDFEDAGGVWPSTAPTGYSSIAEWLLEVDEKTGLTKNAKVLMFSRHSGTATK